MTDDGRPPRKDRGVGYPDHSFAAQGAEKGKRRWSWSKIR
jgi:hypothetical protein